MATWHHDNMTTWPNGVTSLNKSQVRKSGIYVTSFVFGRRFEKRARNIIYSVVNIPNVHICVVNTMLQADFLLNSCIQGN